MINYSYKIENSIYTKLEIGIYLKGEETEYHALYMWKCKNSFQAI